ncbi:ABC transporter substrate-binding protein [Pseudochelatococcus sp. B33]
MAGNATFGLTRRSLSACLAAGLVVPFLARRARAADRVDLRLDWVLSGYHVPFYWAKEKGYYRDAGIDIDIKLGTGSGTALNLLAAREATFAMADSMVAANSIARGMPIKSIFVHEQVGGWAIASWADKPIRQPQDMIGRSIAAAADQKAIVDLFIAVNKLPKDEVTIRVVSAATRNTVFLQRQVDAIVSAPVGSLMDMIVAAQAGTAPPVHVMSFSDFGITAFGHGISALNETIAANPDLVRRFIAASIRGVEDAGKNADEATDAALRLSETHTDRRTSIKLQWLETMKRLHTPASVGQVVGWMSASDWQNCVDILLTTGVIAQPLPVDNLYTNAFFPS